MLSAVGTTHLNGQKMSNPFPESFKFTERVLVYRYGFGPLSPEKDPVHSCVDLFFGGGPLRSRFTYLGHFRGSHTDTGRFGVLRSPGLTTVST